MKHALKVLALGAAFAVSATMANAQFTYNSAGISGGLTGTLVSPSDTGVDTVTGVYTATYTENVYRGGTDSLCSTCLTFVITVSNSSGSKDSLGSISTGDPGAEPTGNGFQYYNVDASFLDGTMAPVAGTEDLGTGTITFNFVNNSVAELAPGDTTTLIIETNALNFTTGNIGINDSVATNEPGFIPDPPVPEPSSLALLGTSLLGFAGVARRRFFRK